MEKSQMMKRIIVEVDSTEDNARIESYLKRWVAENFQKYKEAKITIEDLETEEKKEDDNRQE
jgi:hypothetical protein